MPTCVQKPIRNQKKKSRKSPATQKKKKHTRTKTPKSSDDSPRTITVQFVNPLNKDTLQIVPMELIYDDEFPLFATDILQQVCSFDIQQTEFFHLICIRECVSKKQALLGQPEPISFMYESNGNAWISTSLLKPGALYELFMQDVREFHVPKLNEQEIEEIRQLFLSMNVNGKEHIDQDEILDFCWKNENVKLKELKELQGNSGQWNELAEKRKARSRLAIVLKSLKNADLNMDKKISWEEFVLYEAQRRRKSK